MLSRKKARDTAYKLIYEYLFLKEPNEKSLLILTSIEISQDDLEYINAVYYGIIQHYDELLEIIGLFADKFKTDRIFRLDLAALLLAIYEMKYMRGIPHSVAISEAVELVKTYSTEKSHKYVNGILSSVYKMLNEGGKE
jgi:N utilization substance protein B